MELDAKNQDVSSTILPTKALEKNPSLPLPSCGWLLAILGIGWLVGAALQCFPLPSHGLALCVSSLYYTDICHWTYLFFTFQYCTGFAIHQHESTMGIHVFLMLNPSPTFLPIPSLWVISAHQPQASSITYWTWTGDSFHIWCYTCFHAILPNHSTLSLSHRVQKTVLYICRHWI